MTAVKECFSERKKEIGILGICILLFIAAACGKSTEEKWQEQYDLGQQYLLEENYEEAIVAFTTAIELDPKQANAYIGRGDAYFAWAEKESSSEKYQSAMSDYEAAERLREQAETVAKIEETDSRLSELESGLKQWKAEMTEEEESIVQNAIAALEGNDNQSIKDALIYSGLTDIIEKYGYDSWNGSRKLMDYGDTLNGTGATFEIWYGNMGKTLSVLYGTWKDGLADGNGSYVSILYGIENEIMDYTEQYQKAIGTWTEGVANGSFTCEQTFYGGRREGDLSVITGDVKNSFWHGDVMEVMRYSNPEFNDYTVYSTFVDGIPQQKGSGGYPQYGTDENGELSDYVVGGYNPYFVEDGLRMDFILTTTTASMGVNASLSYYVSKNQAPSLLVHGD